MIDSVNVGLSAMEELNQTMNAPVDMSTFDTMRDAIAQASAGLAEYGSTADGQISRATQAQREMNQEMGRGTSEAHGLMDAVKGMVATYATVRTAAAVVGASDELVQTTTRLNLMNDCVQTTDELLQMVYSSAQNARGSFSGMADVVARFGNNAKDAFGSSAEVVAFAELVQKQMTVAGATTAESGAAMLQLSQALGSGVLRGDELNSIFEQAPNLIQNIADYLDVPIGQIREMASEGQLSADVVKSAIFAASDEINANFESMPMTWGQVWQSMKNTALMEFRPVLQKINGIANSEAFQAFSSGAVQALSSVASAAAVVFGFLVGAGGLIADNWSWISPVIYGAAMALGVYVAYLGLVKAAEKAGAAVKIAAAAASYAHAAATGAAASATAQETAAQYGLNAALLSSPITWIIVLIIALVALLYMVIGLVNKTAGTSVSATGIICGAFATAGAFIGNLFITAINLVIDAFVVLWNFIAMFANFFATVFNDPVAAIANLFGDLVDTLLSLLQSLASAIDTIFGSNLAGAVSGWRNSLGGWVDSTFGKGEEVMKRVNAQDYHVSIGGMDRFRYGSAYNAGYQFGEGIDERFRKTDPSKLFNSYVPGPGEYADASAVQDIGDGVGDIAGNTGSIANSMDVTKEELKYLRDIAERDVINRFTTASIKVDMTNNNTVNNEMDLDGITEHLRSTVEEQMYAAAEGVH